MYDETILVLSLHRPTTFRLSNVYLRFGYCKLSSNFSRHPPPTAADYYHDRILSQGEEKRERRKGREAKKKDRKDWSRLKISDKGGGPRDERSVYDLSTSFHG